MLYILNFLVNACNPENDLVRLKYFEILTTRGTNQKF
jgi:hypothetical protein